MASIPVGGLATGLDTNSLIDQLMAAERQPVQLLETRKLKFQAVSTAFTDLNSKLLALQSKADTLRDPGIFFGRSVSSSAESVATATAAPGEHRGTYTITVSALARGSIAAAANTKASLSDTVATTPGTFTFKLGATGAEISVSVDGSTTLSGLAKAINDKNAGVRATVVNTGTSATPAWKLSLVSSATGAANDIAIVHDDTTLGVANTQNAADAAFAISGLGDFKRSTNTFSDVIDGITIALKAGSGSTDLSIDYDKSLTQARVQALLDGYNDVVRTIASQSAPTTGASGQVTPGVFGGDIAPRQIRLGLAAAIATASKSAFRTLADVGITTQRDGTLTLESAKLQKALIDDPAAVAQLFAGADGTDGIADLIHQKVDLAIKSATGIIGARQAALTATVRVTQRQIDSANARLEVTERGLRARFANLETVVSQLQASGNALLSQLSRLGSSTTR